MKEKLINIKNAIVQAGKEVFYFLSSMIFLKSFGAMIGTCILLLLLTIWSLRCYTNHGDAIEVVDFKNMTLTEAYKIAEDLDLELTVLDSIFLVDRDPGIVIEQTPKSNASVKEGRTIYITATKYQPDMYELPLLAESSYDYNLYKKVLARKGITTKIKERVFDSRQAANTIVYLEYDGKRIEDSDIKKGVEVPMGSTLEFIITESVSRTVKIPNLVCRGVDEAKFLVTSSALRVGNIYEDGTVTNRGTAYVWKQVPPYQAGTQIEKSTQFDLYITQEQPDGCQ